MDSENIKREGSLGSRMVSDIEATMEMVLPVLVTDVMQALEEQGKHPEADFTQRLRVALLRVVPKYPEIEQDVWEPGKKQALISELCELIEL